ncbi:MAG: helix-turn-helix transcriptional regulator [Mycobacteriaceae bacterium]|nr:helix-turn-helix transcriptional regulator [Mycobacteriaceae bacterium]
MNVLPVDGIARLFFFLEDRLAQLHWTREDLARAGGPSPSTLYKAGRREAGLSARTLARLDYALGWQEGSAQRVLAGQSPTIRVSEQVNSCSSQVDAALRDAECAGISQCAAQLKNFLLDVAQRLDDFYAESTPTREVIADAGSC